MSDFRIRRLERRSDEPETCPKLAVEAWFGTKPNALKSKLAGHEVHEDCPWIKVSVPGEPNKSVPEHPWTEQDKKYYPDTYKALMAAETSPEIEGMPLDQWPQVTRGLALTLRSANIYTVEALAEVNDGNIGNLGHGGRELRDRARKFLEVSKTSAAADRISDLERQVAALMAKLNGEKRGPGRPRKVEAA